MKTMRQGLGDSRLARVAKCISARGPVVVDFGLECVSKLAGGGAEGDECAASGNGVDLKSLTFEPVLHSIQIVCGSPNRLPNSSGVSHE